MSVRPRRMNSTTFGPLAVDTTGAPVHPVQTTADDRHNDPQEDTDHDRIEDQDDEDGPGARAGH